MKHPLLAVLLFITASLAALFFWRGGRAESSDVTTLSEYINDSDGQLEAAKLVLREGGHIRESSDVGHSEAGEEAVEPPSSPELHPEGELFTPTAEDVGRVHAEYIAAKTAIMDELKSVGVPLKFSAENLDVVKSLGLDFVTMEWWPRNGDVEGGIYTIDPTEYPEVYRLRDLHADYLQRSGEGERRRLEAEAMLRFLVGSED